MSYVFMKRQIVRMSDEKVFESISSAERELNVYNITYNCQNKINYVSFSKRNRSYCY